MNVSVNPLTGGLNFVDLSDSLTGGKDATTKDINEHFNPKPSKYKHLS